jgi:hypothetical protein
VASESAKCDALLCRSFHQIGRSGERSAPLGQSALLGGELTSPDGDSIRRLSKTTRRHS